MKITVKELLIKIEAHEKECALYRNLIDKRFDKLDKLTYLVLGTIICSAIAIIARGF